jgi:hypothetical protein
MLHGLRDAVAADGLRAVAGHDADDEAPDDRNADDEPPEVVVRGAREGRRPAAVEREVRDEADERRQQARDDRRDEPEADREAADAEDALVDRGALERQATHTMHGRPSSPDILRRRPPRHGTR